MRYKLPIKSSIGDFTVIIEDSHIIEIKYEILEPKDVSLFLLHIAVSFKAYFNGFDSIKNLPISPKGTEFQKKIWKEIQKIPYGEVRTYGYIAKELKTAALAVGTACGKNPIPLIIPCHRVVSAKGLSKYSWGKGVETKKQLLKLEGYLL